MYLIISRLVLLLFLLQSVLYVPLKALNPDVSAKYFCTAADSTFFSGLLNLIGSIHHVHFDETQEIAVFNLGFTSDEVKKLQLIQKVKIYDVEKTNPHILSFFPTRPKNGKPRRGWYSWKPVVIKQALEMFDLVLYLDAATLILKPIDDLFKHIEQNGYFFVDCGHPIRSMATSCVIEKYELEADKNSWVLDTNGMSAGFQGVSRQIYDFYVVPMYEMSKNIKNFIDDGTAPLGFGHARHDQSLFSIQACMFGLSIMKMNDTQQFPMHLRVDDQQKDLYITWHPKYVNQKTHILLQNSRWRDYRRYIKYKG